MTDSRLPGGPAMPIAIIGIGCRFPGGVRDAAGFWRLLSEGGDAISEIPANRFDIAQFFDERPATPGRIMSRWGGFLDDIEQFDAAFFGLSPIQAERLDPQQRLLLETAWEALEDAGQDVATLSGTPTGVFVGQWISDFENRLFADPQAVDFPMTLGSGRYAASGRISYALGLRGPSLTIDAACTSGLAAVHLAVRSLRAGDGDLALAGGANVILQPHIHVAYSQSRMMAPDGRCKFGDAAGDGYVRAEGAALVVLKPLAKAIADGDRVYAVIRGSALNNDGDSSGSMGSPSAVGQEELLRAAFRDAGVVPGRVGYIEAHGTGTRAGDPVELGALGAVLGDGRTPGTRAWVGSVKTNVGHTEAAAGVAGLIKTALALHHGAIPPSLHHRTPNPAIPWADLPVAIPTTLTAWPAIEGPRIAGVSSFGIAGTNTHIVLEGAPAATASESPAAGSTTILPLSARSDAALRQLASAYVQWLETHAEFSVDDICWNAAVRRSSLVHRAAFVATDRSALTAVLQAYAAGGPATCEGVHYTGRPKVAFVVPGQGGQWPGMARQMLAQEEVFRCAVEECEAAAQPYIEWSILEQLQLDPPAPGYLGDRIDVIQPLLVVLAIAYARWLRSVGIEPDAVVGHSLGEVGAAAVAGVLDLDQAMRVICRRSALMRRTSGQGAMALVDLPAHDVRERLAGREARLSVAVSNSPRSTVISGDPDSVREMFDELEREGVFCRLVKVDVASHSPQMAPLAVELAHALSDLRPSGGTIPIYSTVLGARAEGAQFDATYWARNLREPVRFGDAVTAVLHDDITVFVELGPHPVLSQAVQQNAHAADRAVTVAACGQRDEPAVLSAYRALAALWTVGVSPNWRRVLPPVGFVPLPLYPWQRERHWLDSAVPASADGAVRSRPLLDDETRRWLYVPHWELVPFGSGSVSPKRWLVVSASLGNAQAVTRSLAPDLGTAVSVSWLEDAVEWMGRATPDERTGLGVVFLIAPDDPHPAYDVVRALRQLTRAWSSDGVRSTPRIWWVTSGAHVLSGDAVSAHAPEHAAVWGAARVMAAEHPDWWGGLVDVDSTGGVIEAAQLIARHLHESGGEDQVALRRGERHALRLVKADTPTSASGRYQWRTDAAYLITGGFGGVAQQVAMAMVEAGARRLVLVGRTALPERSRWAEPASADIGRRIAAVKALERAGAAVHVMHADVSDERALRAALADYDTEGWPPIAGVIHTAAVLDSRLTADMDKSTFDRVMEPKLAGALVLDRVLPDLDLFVVFSSISAFWAPAGLSNYAAANAGLDTLAQVRRARGQHALSIQWGPWANVGLHDGAIAARSSEELERDGIGWISADAGRAVFGALLTWTEPAITVLPIDWSVFRRARRGRDWPLVRSASGPDMDAAEAPTAGLVARIREASPAERRALIESAVRDALGRVLRLVPAQLDLQRPFGTMGLDSLMALELRSRLETSFERSFPATLAWNYPTIGRLTAYLDGQFAPDAPNAADVVTASTGVDMEDDEMSRLLHDLSPLSDEDAARALRGEG